MPRRLAAHAGLGPEHLLETTEYCVESYVGDYKAVAEVRERLLGPPWPASTGALCHSLLRPEFGLEVFPTALYPASTPGSSPVEVGAQASLETKTEADQ